MEILTGNEKETFDLGVKMASFLHGGEIILLSGDLGSGKTVFVKGLAEGLNINDEITSPTYVLLRSYGGRLNLYHFDFYRLSGKQLPGWLGWEEIGTDEKGICAIEWPEGLPGNLPGKKISLRFLHSGQNNRLISITGDSLNL